MLNERGDAGRDQTGQMNLSRETRLLNSQVQARTEIIIHTVFPVQLAISRIDDHYPVGAIFAVSDDPPPPPPPPPRAPNIPSNVIYLYTPCGVIWSKLARTLGTFFFRMALGARPQWIRSFPLVESPRTGEGLFEGEVIEVTQVLL